MKRRLRCNTAPMRQSCKYLQDNDGSLLRSLELFQTQGCSSGVGQMDGARMRSTDSKSWGGGAVTVMSFKLMGCLNTSVCACSMGRDAVIAVKSGSSSWVLQLPP
jgi:hypothetical protein